MTIYFVFGSNEAGRHGRGAALTAVEDYGANYGQGSGPQGHSYAIPTKDKSITTLPLKEIAEHVGRFKRYARDHPDDLFLVTRIGCGLAGYKDEDIAPLFQNSPSNCFFDPKWGAIITSLRSVPRG